MTVRSISLLTFVFPSLSFLMELTDAHLLNLPHGFKFENLPMRRDIANVGLEHPRPAYNVDGDLIMPTDYCIALGGATVALSCSITHYAFASRESDSAPGSDTHVADVVKTPVLVPPAPRDLQESPKNKPQSNDNDSLPPCKIARLA